MDLLICLDDAHARRIEGPDYDGPKDAPIWALHAVNVIEPDGEWDATFLGEG